MSDQGLDFIACRGLCGETGPCITYPRIMSLPRIALMLCLRSLVSSKENPNVRPVFCWLSACTAIIEEASSSALRAGNDVIEACLSRCSLSSGVSKKHTVESDDHLLLKICRICGPEQAAPVDEGPRKRACTGGLILAGAEMLGPLLGDVASSKV